MYTFHYTITEDDFILFNKHHIEKIPSGKRAFLQLRLMLLLLILFIVFLTILVPENIVLNVFLLSIVLSLIIFLKPLSLWLTRILSRKRAKKGKPLYVPHGTLLFDAHGITDLADQKEIRYSYSALQKMYITKTAFYFYYNDTHAFLLPYRSFQSQEEINQFYAWIRFYLGDGERS